MLGLHLPQLARSKKDIKLLVVLDEALALCVNMAVFPFVTQMETLFDFLP